MRVLITGAGLIGASSAAVLAARGDAVVLFDLVPDLEWLSSVLPLSTVSVVQGDVRDLELLRRSAEDHGIDTLVHTAAIIAGRAQVNPYQSYEVNVGGAVNVAEAARSVHARRIVYCSTYGVYDMARCQVEPIAEDAAIAQDFELVYSATKYAAECILSAFSRTHDIQVITLRLASVFGRGTFVGGAAGGAAVHQLLVHALAGEPAPVLPGLQVRNEWLYAKDAAVAVAAACGVVAIQPYTVYNIGSGVLHTPEELLAAVQVAIPGVRFDVQRDPHAVRPPERAQPFDLRAAERALGYRPALPMREALADYLAELRNLGGTG